MKKFVIPLIILLLMASGLPLTAERVAVLEEVNKPEQLLLAYGSIYILEGVTIYMYDAHTYKYKGRFGKEGEGPAEIKKNPFGGPLLITPHRNKIHISSLAKYSIYSKDGQFEKEFKINAFDNFYPFGDRFVCLSTYGKEPGKLYLSVFLADKNFKKAKEPIVVSDSMVGQNFQLRFPFTSFAPTPYKDKLFVAHNPSKFAIEVYDKTGHLVRTITKEYKRKKVTAEYRDKTQNWFKKDPNWRNFYQAFRSRITFRDYYPPIFALIVDNDLIYVPTFNYDSNGDRECIIMDLMGKEVKRTFLPMKENYGMDFLFPYNIYKGIFYILKENLDDENWELHRIKL